MLCAVPLLRALRTRYPASNITLMTSPVNDEIMQHLRYVDETICFDKRAVAGLRFAGFIRDLRRRRFDLAIVPATVSVSVTSDLLARLSGAPYRLGPVRLDGRENPTGYLFNMPVELDWSDSPNRHQTLRNLDIGLPIGLKETNLSHEMTFTQHEIDDANHWYERQIATLSGGITLHPGAGKTPNRWPVERFVQLGEILSREFGARLFVTSGPMDGAVLAEFRRHVKVEYQLIENQPIRRVASYLRRMNLVISNDTGIMHVAAAAGAPVLALFGPTDPGQWAPIGNRNRYIAGKGGRTESITVEEVVAAARSMLAG